jgi:hypothetical protein
MKSLQVTTSKPSRSIFVDEIFCYNSRGSDKKTRFWVMKILTHVRLFGPSNMGRTSKPKKKQSGRNYINKENEK